MEKVLRWFPNKLDLEIPNPGSVTPIMGEKRISLGYLSDITIKSQKKFFKIAIEHLI